MGVTFLKTSVIGESAVAKVYCTWRMRNAISGDCTYATFSPLVTHVRAMILYKYAVERYRLRGINMEQ